VQWAKYEMYDDAGNLAGSAGGVSCVTYTYEPYYAEVTAYSFDVPMDVEGTPSADFENFIDYEGGWERNEEDKYYEIDFGNYMPETHASQNCLALTHIDLADAPDFGYYLVTYGSKLIKEDGTEIDIAVGETDVEFRAPNLDIGQTDVQVQDKIDNQATIDYDGKSWDIKQDIFIGYEIINDIDSDNILGFLFELDISAKLIPDRAIIYQYLQYKKSDDPWADWVGVACKTQVGNRDGVEVINFRGQEILDGMDYSVDPAVKSLWNEQHSAEKVEFDPRDGSEFFRIREDDEEVYKLDDFGSSTAGNKVQRCLAQLEFPKDMDPEWFGNYTVYVGARIYQAPLQARFIAVPEMSLEQDFRPPEYNEDIEEAIYFESKKQVQNFLWEESEVDSSAVCGTDVMGKIRIMGDLEMNPAEDSAQLVKFTMEAGVPDDCFANVEGMIVAGHFSLTPFSEEADDWLFDEQINVVCRSVAGNAFKHWASNFDASFDATTANLLDDSAALPEEEQIFVNSPDFEEYESWSEDGFTYINCAVELAFWLDDEEIMDTIFDTVYLMEGGAQVYADTSATSGDELATFETELWLPHPEYNEYMTVETDQVIAEWMWVQDVADAINVEGAKVVQHLSIDFKTSMNMDEDDFITFVWDIDVPDSLVTDNNAFVNWIEFKKELDFSGNSQKIACENLPNSSNGDSAEIYTFYGTNSFDDDGEEIAGQTYTGYGSNEYLTEALAAKDDDTTIYVGQPAEKTGYTHFTCIAIIDMPKFNRNYEDFGDYIGMTGLRYYDKTDANAFVSLSKGEIKYTLNEPEYDVFEETSFDERQFFMIKEKTFEIDVAANFDINGRGKQEFFVELIMSKAYNEDDIMRLTWNMDLPSSLMKNGTVVYQYAQLLEEGGVYGTDDLIGVACASVVGNTTNITHVYNYFGPTSLQSGPGISDTVFDETNVDEQLPDYANVFFDYNETYAYSDWASSIEGNREIMCVADMPIPKQNRDEAIFAQYTVIVGAHLYSSVTDNAPKTMKQQRTQFQLEEPDYTAEVVDEKTENLFFDEDDEDKEEVDIEILATTETTLDISATGVTGDAAQNFYTVMQLSDNFDDPDFLNLYFELDMPKELLKDGTIVYQFADLTPSGSSDKIGISCQVTIGDASATKVREFFGSASLDYTTQNGNAVNAQNEANI